MLLKIPFIPYFPTSANKRFKLCQEWKEILVFPKVILIIYKIFIKIFYNFFDQIKKKVITERRILFC